MPQHGVPSAKRGEPSAQRSSDRGQAEHDEGSPPAGNELRDGGFMKEVASLPSPHGKAGHRQPKPRNRPTQANLRLRKGLIEEVYGNDIVVGAIGHDTDPDRADADCCAILHWRSSDRQAPGLLSGCDAQDTTRAMGAMRNRYAYLLMITRVSLEDMAPRCSVLMGLTHEALRSLAGRNPAPTCLNEAAPATAATAYPGASAATASSTGLPSQDAAPDSPPQGTQVQQELIAAARSAFALGASALLCSGSIQIPAMSGVFEVRAQALSDLDGCEEVRSLMTRALRQHTLPSMRAWVSNRHVADPLLKAALVTAKSEEGILCMVEDRPVVISIARVQRLQPAREWTTWCPDADGVNGCIEAAVASIQPHTRQRVEANPCFAAGLLPMQAAHDLTRILPYKAAFGCGKFVVQRSASVEPLELRWAARKAELQALVVA